MSQIMSSLSESSGLTESFEHQFSLGCATPQTSSERSVCKVFRIESYRNPEDHAPEKYTAIGNLSAKWAKDEFRRAAIEEARRWAAAELHGQDGDTVRTYRLRKGWSQVQLAQSIGTSQPHIARIERGAENLTIDTCRRLADALELDMNALDRALRRQQAIAAERVSR